MPLLSISICSRSMTRTCKLTCTAPSTYYMLVVVDVPKKKTRERHSTTCKCIHIYSLLITCQPHSTHTLCYCLAHCFLSSAIFPSPPHWERLHFSLLKFPRSTFFFLVTLLALIWREKNIYLLLSTHVDKTKQSTVINLTLISFGLLYFFSHSKNKLCFHSWNKK